MVAATTAADAARELLLRRRMRSDIVDYARAVPVPGRPMSEEDEDSAYLPIESSLAVHHILLLKTLQRITQTPHGRLMVFMPPGSAKSTYASVVLPSWYLATQNDRRIILACYGEDLARKHGRRTRQLLRDPRGSNAFGVTIASDSSAAQEFALTNGSEYIAAGILSGLTGNRCLPAGVALQTPHGAIMIEHVYPSCQVLAYDHATNRPAFRRVKQVMRSVRADLVRVRTVSGREFICTADHPVYVVGRGYVEAALLEQADAIIATRAPMLRMRQDGDAAQVRMGQARAQGGRESLLLPCLHGSGLSGAGSQVQGMRRSCDGDRAYEGREVLQQGVRAEATPRQQELLSVLDGVSAEIKPDEVLWARVREQGALGTDGRHWQLALQGWQQLSAVVSDDAADCAGARQRRVCRLLGVAELAGTSLRRGSAEQCGGELGDAVSSVPYATPQIEGDTISVVEQVRSSGVTVYDIEVEEAHNFFANEVLVHNCHGIVIDDPIKGRAEADSEVIRERTFQAYEDDLLTRLIPGGWVVIVQTRWHEADLAGRLLPESWAGESGVIKCRDGHDWEVLCLQARCAMQPDPVGRQNGEYLWPEWFDRKHWATFEGNKRTWSALYQQVPSPADGTLFRRADMGTYAKVPSPLRIFGASDYAVSPDDGDWTEHGIFGIDSAQNILVLGWWRGQTGPEVWIDSMCDLILEWEPLVWFGEAGPIRRSVEPFLKKRMNERSALCRIEWLPSVTDKETRAQPIIAMAGMGRVMWPERAPWLAEVQRQLLIFPAGKHDDAVDVLSLIGRGIKFIGATKKEEAFVYPGTTRRGGWMSG